MHDKVETYYKHTIAWYEQPTLLRYTPGGLYKGHADSDNYDEQLDCWHKTLDRSVSLLIYLNDEYTGGAIKFNKFNYRYQPKRGDLLFFPSDFRYMHEAEKVESGVRYALVSWSALSNTPRVMSGRPKNSIVLDESGV
ncbi:MAG: 2OG-Fe(II) oxygenase [Xanthomonadales bacterium]|nr:2OG-Fe(II) oxygenase [Xanthomonadales bacterium]